MNNLHDGATSDRIENNEKIFERLFCFAIEARLHRLCRAFHGASFKIKFKILSFSQAEIDAK
jgi:hypothetical protein